MRGIACLVLLIATPLCAQTVLPRAVIQERLGMVKQEVPERRATLERLFKKEGCEVTTQLVHKSRSRI
jgi:hypothetical protein